MDKGLEINESTKVPLFWVVTALGVSIPVFIGGVMWLTTLYTMAADAQTRTIKMEQILDERSEIFHSIDKRLSRIEDKMGIDKRRN